MFACTTHLLPILAGHQCSYHKLQVPIVGTYITVLLHSSSHESESESVSFSLLISYLTCIHHDLKFYIIIFNTILSIRYHSSSKKQTIDCIRCGLTIFTGNRSVVTGNRCSRIHDTGLSYLAMFSHIYFNWSHSWDFQLVSFTN